MKSLKKKCIQNFSQVRLVDQATLYAEKKNIVSDNRMCKKVSKNHLKDIPELL